MKHFFKYYIIFFYKSCFEPVSGQGQRKNTDVYTSSDITGNLLETAFGLASDVTGSPKAVSVSLTSVDTGGFSCLGTPETILIAAYVSGHVVVHPCRLFGRRRPRL
jgi:hypothetical protein